MESSSFTCHCPCSWLSSAFSSNDSKLRISHERGAVVKLPVQPGKLFLPRRSMSVACHATSSGTSERNEHEDVRLETGVQVRRREAVLIGLAAVFSASGLPLAAIADSAGATNLDVINSYSYAYPTATGNQAPIKFKWVESRKSERYSSAAPLAPDARQRIVSERIDFKNNVVLSVSVGPPNFMILKSNETTDWDAKDVARSVLADKSTSRMTTGQRVAELSILSSHTEEKEGMRYWFYEYLTQKSPTVTQRGLDVYRHSVAVTAERDGFLYSLNASTLDTSWEKFSAPLMEITSSFQMLPVTEEYVPPYKDPWRFW